MRHQWIAVVAAGVFLTGGTVISEDRRANPIIRHMFTADPSAHVWADGRLYLYPSTDVAPPQGCSRMDGYHVFSTDDLITWTDHGEILHSRDVEWGRPEGGYMWAPDCAYRNGTYYYYFPHPGESEVHYSWKIGIASSSRPDGGFVVRGYFKELGGRGMIDPAVFTDDDGQSYMIYGGGAVCHIGKLKENMVEIDGEMADISKQLTDFHEGPWIFKRNGIYYLMYPDNVKPCNSMRYAMSTNVLGPWESKGIMMEPVSSETTHGSVVEYKGVWYIFYHNAALSGGIGNLRSVCFDRLFFNEDGTIQLVKQTLPAGTEIPESGNRVRNPSFEEGSGFFIYAWKTGTTNLSRFADSSVDGAHVLKYTGSGTEPVAQRMSILKNRTYQADVWMKIEPGTAGTAVFDTEDQFDDTCQFTLDASQAGNWIHKSGTFDSGEKTEVTLRCFTTGDFSGICYWDNLSLKVVDKAVSVH
ncbi:MAG: family 43 glycosylhydrolase [Pontiellaceae bacterium]|nr:family 43 glycosylhydrolase [Pontiellaceae bacterium]